MNSPRRVLPASSAALALLLACGGGGGGSSPAPSPDFSLTVTAPPSTRAGSGGTTPVGIGRVNGHTAAVNLSLAANAQGITGSGTIAASASSGTLGYSVPAALAAGTYTLTVNGSDGSSTRSATFSLTTLPYPPNFPAASVAIGQPNFTSNQVNQGGAPAANTLRSPYGDPLFLNGILYLADYGNNRILGFNGIPTASNASAAFVLGQADFATTAQGAAANQLKGPQSIKAYGGKFFVSDYGNSRVLIWNTPPTSTAVPADVVLGQAGFGTNDPATTRTGLKFPESIEVVNGKLIVGDSGNSRVLIWNTIPTTSGAPADLVLGQGDFTHGKQNDDNQDGNEDATPTARTMNYPCGIWSDGTRLIVCDSSNNRVLVWNTFPTSSFQPADRVLGQGDFTHKAFNDDAQAGTNGTAPTARTLNFPYFITSNGTQLYVGDAGNNRVLIYDNLPTTNFAPANRVLGQNDFIHGTQNDDNQDGVADAAPSARTFWGIGGLHLAGTKLLVSSYSNQRCLVFDNP